MLWSFLTTHNQHSLSQLLIFVNLYQQAKNHFILSVHFWVTVNFRVLSPDWQHPFLTMLTPKIFNHLLICGNMCPHAKNHSISSFWRYSQFKSSVTRSATPIFDHAQPKKFLLTFDFCELVSKCKILRCFWRNGWFKYPAIYLAETTLAEAYISGTRFFPNIGFVQEHTK